MLPADVEATSRCFLELIRLSVIGITKLEITQEDLRKYKEANPKPIEAIGLNTQPYNSGELQEEEEEASKTEENTLLK